MVLLVGQALTGACLVLVKQVLTGTFLVQVLTGTFLDLLLTPLSTRAMSFWSIPPCIYICLLYFLVENKVWTTFPLISVGRPIKGRLKSSMDMSRVPILFFC